MRVSLSSLAYGLLLAQVPASLAAPSGPAAVAETSTFITNPNPGSSDSTTSSTTADALFARKAITAKTIPATCATLKHTKWAAVWGNYGPFASQTYATPNTGAYAGTYGLFSKKSTNSASITFGIESTTARFHVVHSGKKYYLGIKSEVGAGYHVADFWPSSLMTKDKLSYALCVECSSGIIQCFTENTGNQLYFLFSTKTGTIWTTEKPNLTGLSGVSYGTLMATNALD